MVKLAKWNDENSYDRQYLDIVNTLLEKAEKESGYRLDRTKVGSYSTFGTTIDWDLKNGFPLLVSKFTAFKTMYTELLFFMKGITNNNWLLERNCHIWTPWANEDGELGPIYGSQLRNFDNQGFDQLQYVIDTLKENPDSRRIIFTYYNPNVLPDESKTHKENIENGKAVLPPCHILYMFDSQVAEDGSRELNGMLVQRSNDTLLGKPFNFSQLALWVHILAYHTGHKPGRIKHVVSNEHVYMNQIDAAKEWLSVVEENKNKEIFYPKLIIHADKDKHPQDYELDDLSIEGYEHLGKFKFDVAV